jgi:hypothetical protein
VEADAGVLGDPTAFEFSDFRLTNVRAAGVDSSAIVLPGDANPNRVTLVNCTADELYSDTVRGEAGLGGGDVLTVVSSRFDDVLAATGEGADVVRLVGDRFDSVDIDLGAGDDTAIALLNVASDSLAIDAGDGEDVLVAWANVAPMIALDDFEPQSVGHEGVVGELDTVADPLTAVRFRTGYRVCQYHR